MFADGDAAALPLQTASLEVAAMQGQVAVSAQRDQVLVGVMAGVAAKLFVMDRQV
jgi:hypothetical protein